MKKLQWIAAGLLACAALFSLRAAMLAPAENPDLSVLQAEPISFSASDLRTLPTLSDDQLTALLDTLDAVPQISAEALPYHKAGTYWSLANPTWPPLPVNALGVSMWKMGADSGTYLLNDLNFDYAAASQPVIQSKSIMMHAGMDPGSGGGGTNVPMYSSYTPPVYDSNTLWLEIIGVSNNVASFNLHNTLADVLYELLSQSPLASAPWLSEGFVNGSELTNWTAMNINVAGRTNSELFFKIRSWIDSNGTGIPDWWWFQYFGQITNIDETASAAGDGYSNYQKFQLGLNPTNYYNPNPLNGFFGSVVGTNVFIYWNSATGAVSYLVQRGVLNTNTGSYVYTQFSVGSNATWFEDVGAITNANAQNDTYSLAAVYPGGNVSGTNTWQAWWFVNNSIDGPPYGPPPPVNVYAYADVTGTNVLLSWTAAPSSLATNYIVQRGISTNYTYVYQQIAQVSTNPFSFCFVETLVELTASVKG